MKSSNRNAWTMFWEERGRSYPDDDPISIDGWDYGISLMGEDEADQLREQVSHELRLSTQSKFLEVGCGAGMFLLPLSEKVKLVTGCDLAKSMLKRARQFDNQLMVQVTEASNLPYSSNAFDTILVYSVFHYFPSNDYAIQTLNELLRVCSRQGRIWIGDVPDKAKQQQALRHREQLMKENVPRWPWPKVGPLEQRFYEKAFFADFCERVPCRYRIEHQSVEGYAQGKYRYNVFIQKL